MGRFACTLARLRWTILVVAVAACQQGRLPLLPDAGVPEPAIIEPSSDTVAIPPGGSHRLGFRVLSAQREPVPGVAMSFTILDNKETPGSEGVQLSLSSGLTDEQGSVILQIIAGTGSEDQKPLHLRAAVGDLAHVLPIFITTGELADAEIETRVENAANGEDAVASTTLYFYENTLCSNVSWKNPADSNWGERTLSPEVNSTVFSNIVTSGSHAVLAVAMGTRGRVVATGCTDLPGASLSPAQLMRVRLPLARIHVSPIGTYCAEARFSLLSAQQSVIEPIRKQWQDLSGRPCDPASIWLDCTIDALNGDSAADPLDCQPAADEEGTLGALLTSRRAKSGGRTCATQLDASGKTSLDAKVYALFPSGFLGPIKLASLPDEVSSTLSQLTVRSTLTVKDSGASDILDIEDVLDTLTLSGFSVQTETLGLPVRDKWFPSPQTSGADQLELAPHGFTLRLGSLARLVYLKGSLVSRLGVPDVGAFISTLFNGASRNMHPNMLQGCEALDSLLCDEAGQERGCIIAACQAGLQTLVKRLDASFSILDGPNLDFFLSGHAPLVDTDGDGQANELDGGLMTATFDAQSSSTAFGMWSAQRVFPPSRCPNQ